MLSNKPLLVAVLTSSLFAPSLVFAARQVVNGADVVGADANGALDGVDFVTDHKLTVQDGENLGDDLSLAGAGDSAIASGGGSFGTLQFDGTSSVSGSITAAGNTLKLVDINAQGGAKTVTITGLAHADDINISTADSTLILNGGAQVTNDIDFLADGKVQLANTKTITGAVDATAGAAGTLEFLGSGNVTGAVGATNNLNLITVNAGAVSTSENVSANTINFAGNGSLSIADNKNVTANITNTTTNQGTLTLNGTHTITGDIGSTGAGLNLLTVGTGGNTVTTTGDIKATTVNFAADGQLKVANTKSITGNVTTTTNNTGTLTFDGAGTVTGNIGTTGGNILKAVELTGANTLNTTGDINATDFNFLGNGVLNVAASKNINGQVSGPGGGGGTINFAGSSTTGGKLGNANALNSVNINAGTLALGHDISSTNTTVAVGAGLTPNVDNLNISNDLNLNGTLNLGSKTLNVGGIYNQNANSALNVTVTGGGAPTSGKVVDTGNAVVDATSTVNVSVTGDAIQDNSIIPIVTSAGGAGVNVPNITGSTLNYTFSLITDNGAAPGKDLFILVNRRSFPEANNMTTMGVARVLEDIAVNPALAPALGFLVGSLNAVPTQQALKDALTTLVPLADGGLTTVTQMGVAKGLQPASQRLDKLRLGLANQPSGYSAGDYQEGRGVWVQFYGHDINQDTRQLVAGYDAVNAGIALGADTDLSDNARVGLALNYAHTDVDSNGVGKSEMDIDTFQAILYGSYEFNSPLYLDALFSIAYNDYDSKRNIVVAPNPAGVGGVNISAFGDFSAWQYNIASELGYIFNLSELIVNPKVLFRYSHLSIDDYTEKGAGPLNLNVSYDDMAQLLLGLGLKVSKKFKMENTTVIPALHAGIFNDFETDKQVSTAAFLGGGASFVTPGPKPDSTSYQVGASVDIAGQNNLLVTLFYDYDFRDDFHAHTGFIKVGCEWG